MRAIFICLALFTSGVSARQFVAITPPSPLAQVNSSGIGTVEFGFLNLAKGSNGIWQYSGGSLASNLPPNLFDRNGMPLYDSTADAHYGWNYATPIPQAYVRPGNYVMSWTGAANMIQLKAQSTASGNTVPISRVACTGATSGTACDNRGCNASQEMLGYIVSTILHITTAPSEGATNCGTGLGGTLGSSPNVVGQPISGNSQTIISGTYNPSTGAVSLTAASSMGASFAAGQTVTITDSLGTGDISQLNGTWPTTSGSSGSTINFSINPGYTMTVAAGGIASPLTTTIFGTPTIIIGMAGSTNCPSCTGTGGVGTYLVNFSQTFASSGTPGPINPGGRLEFTYGLPVIGSTSWLDTQDNFYVYLHDTATSSFQSNIAENLGIYYTCGATAVGTVPCTGADDEPIYWTGQIAGTQFKAVMQTGKIGVIRDLGWTDNILNQITTWSSRKTTSYFNWGGTENRNSIYTGCPASANNTQGCQDGAGGNGGNPVQEVNITTSFTGTLTAGATSNSRLLTISGVTGTVMPGQYLDAAHILGYINDGNGAAPGDSTPGTVLTVTNVNDGALAIGENVYDANGYVSGSGATGVYTEITGDQTNSATCGPSACTGTGGTGTYLVSISQYVSSSTLRDGTATINVTNVGIAPGTTIAGWSPTLPGTRACSTCTGTGGNGTYSLFCQFNSGVSTCIQPGASSQSMATVAYQLQAAIDSVPPVDKETLIVQWPSSTMLPNPGTYFFSADGGTTFKILGNLGMDPADLVNTSPESNAITSITYDATFQEWGNWGGYLSQCCGTDNQIGIVNFMPPEATAEMAYEVGLQPWFTLPYMASDPLTDYTIQTALYVIKNYPNMKPEFETTDETWNDVTPNGDYALLRPTWYSLLDSNWSANDVPNFTGKTASNMCQGVSRVYGGQTWRYRCIVGFNTNQSYKTPSQENGRMTAASYVAQSPSNIPTQSGCAGPGASQLDCPAPFQRAAGYNWITETAPMMYFSVSGPGTQSEVSLAYQFFTAQTLAAQQALMVDYLNVPNQFPYGNAAFFINYIWPQVYNWAIGCGSVVVPGCKVRGIAPYEGDYQNPSVSADTTLAVTGPATASAGNACILNTVQTIANTYVNDGGASGDGIAGNHLGPGTLTFNTGGLQTITSVTLSDGSHPVVLGTWNQITGVSSGYGLSNSALPIYVAPSSNTFAANGAVQGMEVTLKSATGGTWASIDNTSYYVGPNPTVSAFSLYQDAALTTPFDCSGLGTLTSLTVDYTGSENYINYFRAVSYLMPALSSVIEEMENGSYSFNNAGSGAGGSFLNTASPNIFQADGSGLTPMGSDIYGAMIVGGCTACSVSGNVLTLGGVITGRFAIGQTIYGGQMPGPGSPTPTIITGYLTGNNGTTSGDTLSLSNSGTVTAQYLFTTNALNGGVVSTGFSGISGAYQGTRLYGAQHGGWLFKDDGKRVADPAANDNTPMYLQRVG